MQNFENPHRRYNPLSGEWVLVSPHRTKRPWLGKQEDKTKTDSPSYDSQCYLCPGNTRSSGVKNDNYKDTFVFTNDFPALLTDNPDSHTEENDLFQSTAVTGTAKVICFSPQHNLSLPEMPVGDILKVVQMWCDQSEELGQKYKWVQIFENKGAIMGSSIPHPHGQIWAGDFIPNGIIKEDRQQKEYSIKHNSPLLLDYLNNEQEKRERIVYENEHWVVLVPFWAVWPYETILLPKRHILRLPDITRDEKEALADILKILLCKYDNLFETSFPYTMGWHGAPYTDDKNTHWQLHAHFYPPLLRSATVKKFMVGYEMLAEAQRDITAEQSAEMLRSRDTIHYSQR